MENIDDDIEQEFKNLVTVIYEGVEDDFSAVKEERVFPDLDYNIIAMPYFNKFQLWKPFLYDMFPF